MLIKFNTKFLKKGLLYLAVFGIILSATFFLTLPFSESSIYFLCSIFIFAALMYVFYRNRFEILTLKAVNDTVELSFINKSFFKRKDMKLSLPDINASKEGAIIHLANNGQQFAVIRQSSVTTEEWEQLSAHFLR